MEHSITPTLSELTAEVERLKAQRDSLILSLKWFRDHCDIVLGSSLEKEIAEMEASK
jgi:hypothetical protein